MLALVVLVSAVVIHNNGNLADQAMQRAGFSVTRSFARPEKGQFERLYHRKGDDIYVDVTSVSAGTPQEFARANSAYGLTSQGTMAPDSPSGLQIGDISYFSSNPTMTRVSAISSGFGTDVKIFLGKRNAGGSSRDLAPLAEEVARSSLADRAASALQGSGEGTSYAEVGTLSSKLAGGTWNRYGIYELKGSNVRIPLASNVVIAHGHSIKLSRPILRSGDMCLISREDLSAIAGKI